MKSKDDIKAAKNEIMTFILQTDSMSDIMVGINVLKHIRAIGEPLEYNQEAGKLVNNFIEKVESNK